MISNEKEHQLQIKEKFVILLEYFLPTLSLFGHFQIYGTFPLIRIEDDTNCAVLVSCTLDYQWPRFL